MRASCQNVDIYHIIIMILNSTTVPWYTLITPTTHRVVYTQIFATLCFFLNAPTSRLRKRHRYPVAHALQCRDSRRQRREQILIQTFPSLFVIIPGVVIRVFDPENRVIFALIPASQPHHVHERFAYASLPHGVGHDNRQYDYFHQRAQAQGHVHLLLQE